MIIGQSGSGKTVLMKNLVGLLHDSVWKFKGKTFVLVDTAGMRKKSKIDEPVEKWHSLLPNAEILPISAKNKFGTDMPVSYTHLMIW